MFFTVYSSSKANAFLTYDKCMQRMKCPANRKEECSEECTAGMLKKSFVVSQRSEMFGDDRQY